MRVIYNPCTDPYFNLASEEYLLEFGRGDAFMIWRNEKSVIVGKNQNAYGEVDRGFCEKNDVKVVRRLTGGGAVFHDLGNVNFSFVTDDTGEGINFLPYVERICAALAFFGIAAVPNGRNDIEVGGTKISGNAQCVHNCRDGRKRLLHHGTLLFSADMSSLAGALRADREKMESKGIKSIRSRVANIRDVEGYAGPEDPEEFARELCGLLEREQAGDFSKEEKEAIEALAKERYSRWEWNFGESPRFFVERKRRFPYGTVFVAYTARKGSIEEISISGDFFAVGDISRLEGKLIGVSLDESELRRVLADVNEFIYGASCEEIAELLLKNIE